MAFDIRVFNGFEFAHSSVFLAGPQRLRQDFGNDFPVHIGEPAINAVVAEGQLFMVDAQQMENRCM